MPQPEQLTLPYAEIKGAATQKVLREHFNRSSTESYQIKLNLIHEREGFNQRKVYKNIPELADMLLQHGQKDPMWLNIEPDGTAYVIRGHRRLRAFKLLAENALIPEDYLVDFIPKKMTELEMFLDQELSNAGEKMEPVERAEIAFGLKFNFGEELTNAEVAKLMCISRQQVDNLIILAQAPDSIKDQMIKQELNMKDALAIISNEKKLNKQSEKEELKHSQSSMYITQDAKDVNAEDIAASNELEKSISESDSFEVEYPETDANISENGEVRTTNNISGETKPEGQPLSLVGNLAGEKNNDKKDKSDTKFDESRNEIVTVNKIITGIDKLEAIVTKLDVPEDVKKDIAYQVYWLQRNAEETREWIQKNKPQNKRGH